MIGWKELLIVLVIVLLIFGTKRLANIGKDLGEGIKGFKKGMHDGQDEEPGKLGADKPDADKSVDASGSEPRKTPSDTAHPQADSKQPPPRRDA